MRKMRFYLVLILLSVLAACKGESGGTQSGNQQNTIGKKMGITREKALEIAKADAIVAYQDLSPYKVEIAEVAGNWQVDFELKDENSLGGGPHYLIDGNSGEILKRRYEQ